MAEGSGDSHSSQPEGAEALSMNELVLRLCDGLESSSLDDEQELLDGLLDQLDASAGRIGLGLDAQAWDGLVKWTFERRFGWSENAGHHAPSLSRPHTPELLSIATGAQLLRRCLGPQHRVPLALASWRGAAALASHSLHVGAAHQHAFLPFSSILPATTMVLAPSPFSQPNNAGIHHHSPG